MSDQKPEAAPLVEAAASLCGCPKPKPGCCPANCIKPQCLAYTGPQLFCKFADAVVDIAAEFIFLGKGQGTPSDLTPIGTTGGSAPINIRQDNFIFGNGALLEDKYILCAAANVQAPCSVTSFANLWPNNELDTDAIIADKYVRASRILVTVHNVNRKGAAYVYEADLVGTGGAAGFALLRISEKAPFNKSNPCILPCHPTIEFGDSLAEDEASRVYLIGNPVGGWKGDNASRHIVEGLVAKRNYVEHSGWARVEEMSVVADVYSKALGLPILNGQGQLIGIQTRNISGDKPTYISASVVEQRYNFSDIAQVKGNGWVAGPSSRAIRHMVCAFIDAANPQVCAQDPHVQVISDAAGDFLIYQKAYLGLAYHVLQGVDYDTTTDYTALTTGGLAPWQLRRVRLDENGQFLNSPGNKQIAGVKVIGLSGLNPTDQRDPLGLPVSNGAFYVPGGTGAPAPLLSYFFSSPLISGPSALVPGDVIVGLASTCPDDQKQVFFGDELGKQIAPSLVLWSKEITPGDNLDLVIRRGGNALNNASNAYGTGNYQGLEEISATTLAMPPHMDYPWGDLQHFSGFDPNFLLATGWQLPLNQSASPLYPALIPGAPFRAAI